MKAIKKTILLISFALLTMAGFSQAHVTMSLQKISYTSSTIEYDLYIVNDGKDVLKLSALSYGINFNQAILNDGTISYSYIDKSKDPLLAALPTYATSVSIINNKAQLKMTSTTTGIEKAIILEKNKAYKVGRFRVANTADWTPNSNPALTHQERSSIGLTTSLMLGYVGISTKLIALTPALKTVTTLVEKSPVLNQEQQHKIMNEKQFVLDETRIKLYPIPATDKISIDFYSSNQTDVIIAINDMKGHIIKKVLTKVQEGLNKFDLSLTELISGVYTIQLSDHGKLNETSTFVKL